MGARQVDEETIRRWISEAIANGGGGASSLVYTAFVTQANALADPVSTILQNTTDALQWITAGDGEYRLNGTFPQNKTYISGFGDFGDAGVPCLPITDSGDIVGYYFMYANGTNVVLWVMDAAFAQVTLFSLIGTSRLYLPKIEVYP